jgi:NAD(P)-dependent dehydrogenase (short-subunit alcohol dehydrogenase family)
MGPLRPPRDKTLTACELTGTVALVTGSTSGIGLGIARALLDDGAAVMLHGLAAEGGEVVRSLVEAGACPDRLAYLGADLAEVEACGKLVAAAVDRFGGVDVLVNNAADVRRGTLDSTDRILWDYQMNVNLRAPFLLTQAAVVSMRRRGGGSVVNIGSVNAYVGQGDLTAYSVSKGGLMTLTRNLAQQLATSGARIRVNQINVGWTLTAGERQVQREQGAPEGWEEAAGKARPLDRLLLPEDVAAAVRYLVGPQAAAINGSVLDLEQFPAWGPGVWNMPGSD